LWFGCFLHLSLLKYQLDTFIEEVIGMQVNRNEEVGNLTNTFRHEEKEVK
jgi:hypothetical protein